MTTMPYNCTYCIPYTSSAKPALTGPWGHTVGYGPSAPKAQSALHSRLVVRVAPMQAVCASVFTPKHMSKWLSGLNIRLRVILATEGIVHYSVSMTNQSWHPHCANMASVTS